MAREYAKLIKDLWKGTARAVAPQDFKYALSQFAPQFEGMQQHDSQEFLSFLLDGLHEDLNRVLDKPPTETVDGVGRPDEEVSQEAWARYELRNRSVIVDHFSGQLKYVILMKHLLLTTFARSTVQCPKCQRISVTFDPFLFLSIPLPSKQVTKVQVCEFFATCINLLEYRCFTYHTRLKNCRRTIQSY